MMQRILEKMSWKLRRYDIAFSPFYVRWAGGDSSFQIAIVRIDYNLHTHSLFDFSFRLPNKTYVKTFTVDSWDFFFLYRYLFNYWSYLGEKELWQRNSLTFFEKWALKVLTKIM